MYRAAGPREIWAEHLLCNPGSFDQVASMTSDDWRLTAGNMQISPARVAAGQGQIIDDIAYVTTPPEDGWIQHFHGTPSPAKVKAGANLGTNQDGQLT
jgi:hypothetical protein